MSRAKFKKEKTCDQKCVYIFETEIMCYIYNVLFMVLIVRPFRKQITKTWKV